MEEVLLILLVSSFVSAFVCVAIFKTKERHLGGGFALGFLFGLLGIVVALFIPPDKDVIEQKKYISGQLARCPYCKEYIKKDAVICKHCHHTIEHLQLFDNEKIRAAFSGKPTAGEINRSWYITGGILSLEALLFGIINQDATPFVNSMTLIPLSTLLLSYFKPINWVYSTISIVFLQGVALIGYILGGGSLYGSELLFIIGLVVVNAILCAVISFFRLRKKVGIKSSERQVTEYQRIQETARKEQYTKSKVGTVEVTLTSPNKKICPKCKIIMTIREHQGQKYYVCPNYKQCRQVIPVEQIAHSQSENPQNEDRRESMTTNNKNQNSKRKSISIWSIILGSVIGVILGFVLLSLLLSQ